jgi:hypothetical protein
VLTQGTRAKLAEQAIEAATLGYRRLNERKELAEIIERALARAQARRKTKGGRLGFRRTFAAPQWPSVLKQMSSLR